MQKIFLKQDSLGNSGNYGKISLMVKLKRRFSVSLNSLPLGKKADRSRRTSCACQMKKTRRKI